MPTKRRGPRVERRAGIAETEFAEALETRAARQLVGLIQFSDLEPDLDEQGATVFRRCPAIRRSWGK